MDLPVENNANFYDDDEDNDDIFDHEPSSPSDSDYFSTEPMDEEDFNQPQSPYPVQVQHNEDGPVSMDWIEFDMLSNSSTPSLGLFLTGRYIFCSIKL